MIVAPLVARVAAEHGLPDWTGYRGAQPPPPGSSGFYVEFRDARTFAVSDLSALLHINLTHNRLM